MKRSLFAAIIAASLLSTAALADHLYPDGGPGAIANQTVPSAVEYCLNASNVAVPVGPNCATPLPVSPTNSSGAPLYVAPVVPAASARHFPGCTVAATADVSCSVNCCDFLANSKYLNGGAGSLRFRSGGGVEFKWIGFTVDICFCVGSHYWRGSNWRASVYLSGAGTPLYVEWN